MSIYFEMVGKLGIGKETDTFKPYSERKFDSGWVNKTLLFNCLSGDNRFGLQVRGGHHTDPNKDDLIYLFTKNTKGENGEDIKGKSITIDFNDRLDYKQMDQIAEWKKYIIDLEKPGRRWRLEQAMEKINNGEKGMITEDELKLMEVDSVESIKEEYVKSLKRRKEFLTEWDYAEYLYKLINSGKVNGKKFKIKGKHNYQYAEKNKKFYESYSPNRIYLMGDDEEEYANEGVTLYYNSESLYEDEENKKATILAKIFVYDEKEKRNIPADYVVTIPIPSKDSEDIKIRRYKKIINLFKVDDDSWKELGVQIKMLDGAQRKQILFEDLDEETQDNILMELTTLEEVQRELGGTMYGERVKENRFKKLSPKYASGRQDTLYKDEDFQLTPVKIDNDLNNDVEDDDLDIFDDIDLD